MERRQIDFADFNYYAFKTLISKEGSVEGRAHHTYPYLFIVG